MAKYPNKHLLVVDDNSFCTSHSNEIIERRLGCQIIYFPDGEFAMEFLSQKPKVDAAIIDGGLGGEVGGIQLIEKLIEQYGNELFIIICSGYSASQLIGFGYKAAQPDAFYLGQGTIGNLNYYEKEQQRKAERNAEVTGIQEAKNKAAADIKT